MGLIHTILETVHFTVTFGPIDRTASRIYYLSSRGDHS